MTTPARPAGLLAAVDRQRISATVDATLAAVCRLVVATAWLAATTAAGLSPSIGARE
jgi:hypothetical protein